MWSDVRAALLRPWLLWVDHCDACVRVSDRVALVGSASAAPGVWSGWSVREHGGWHAAAGGWDGDDSQPQEAGRIRSIDVVGRVVLDVS